MTGATAAEPMVRWDPRRHVLVGADGEFTPTEAQATKAKRYLRDSLIQGGEPHTETHGWGLPSKTTQTYRLSPIPGCRQLRVVRVTTFHDGAGHLTGITYACDCQRSAGTVAVRPDACSHALAVHLHRRDGGQ